MSGIFRICINIRGNIRIRAVMHTSEIDRAVRHGVSALVLCRKMQKEAAQRVHNDSRNTRRERREKHGKVEGALPPVSNHPNAVSCRVLQACTQAAHTRAPRPPPPAFDPHVPSVHALPSTDRSLVVEFETLPRSHIYHRGLNGASRRPRCSQGGRPHWNTTQQREK